MEKWEDIKKAHTVSYRHDLAFGDVVKIERSLQKNDDSFPYDTNMDGTKISIIDFTQTSVYYRRDLSSPSIQYFSQYFDQTKDEHTVMKTLEQEIGSDSNGIRPGAHLDVVRSLNLDAQSRKGKSFLLTAAFVTTGVVKIIDSPILKRGILRFLSNPQGLDDFKHKFGTHWISEAVLGGTFVGLIELKSNRENYMRLQEEETAGKLEQISSLTRYLSEQELTVQVVCQGAPLLQIGKGTGAYTPKGLHELVTQFCEYLEKNETSGYPISYRCSPIETIPQIYEILFK